MNKPNKKIILSDELLDELIRAAYASETQIDHEDSDNDEDAERMAALKVTILRNLKREHIKMQALYAFRQGYNIFKNMAAILVISVMITLLLDRTVGARLPSAWRWITEKTPVYYILQYRETEPSMVEVSNHPNLPDDWHDVFLPEYLPGSYEIVGFTGPLLRKTVICTDDNGNTLYFSMSDDLDSTFAGDADKAEMQDMEINGYPAMHVIKDGILTLHWTNDTYSFMLMGELHSDDLIKIAESIRKIR